MRLTLLALLAACAGDKDTGTTDSSSDSGTDSAVDGTCSDDDACGDGEICVDDACVDGDRNNSLDEAEAILWSDGVTGILNPEDDVDYYVFTAEGGEYVRVATTEDTDAVPDANTFVTIRDPAGKVVTTADGYATGTGVTGVDAVAFAYLADPGVYSISVEDAVSAAGGTGWGDPDYVYTLTLDEWTDVTTESDSAESPGITVAMGDDRVWYTVGTLVGSAGDSDFIAVSVPRGGENLYVDGNADLTGSDLSPHYRLWDADGQLLGEKSNVGPDDYLLYPHLAAGDYVVEVTDAGGQGGDNAWAFTHLITRADSDGYEFSEEVEPDDAMDAAVALPFTEYENSSGKPFSQAQGLGWLDVGGDEDWYQLTSTYASTNIVACLASSWWGSLAAPGLELYDAGGVVLASSEGTEGALPTAHFDSVTVEPGTYYLRVVPPADVPPGAGAWYRFYWYSASFSVASYAEGGYACP